MAVFDGADWSGSISVLKLGGSACEAPPEQNPPHINSPMSGVCMARLSGMASMFSTMARQASQGLMRLRRAMNEVD